MPHDRATVAIAPDEKTYQVSIIDGAGRTVMNALMSGPAATTPHQLLDWTCTQYDQMYALSGYATVSRTNQVNASNKWTSSLVDGFGWSVGSMDEDLNLTRHKLAPSPCPLPRKAGGEGAYCVLETIDPLGHSVTHVYDAVGRTASSTTYAGMTSTSYNNRIGRVDSQTDALAEWR